MVLRRLLSGACARAVHESARRAVSVCVSVGAHPLTISTGELARMADGSATATLGDTTVMATAVCESKAGAVSQNFLPLTVDYRQKAAAAGRIPATFLRRELGPRDAEILTSRMIDRSLRSVFPDGFCYDTQLVCNLMAVDGVFDPDTLAVNAASAALAVSDIPWDGPVAAVRVARIDDEFVVNPELRQLQKSTMDLLVICRSDRRIVTLDLASKAISNDRLIEAVELGIDASEKILQAIDSLRDSINKPKRQVEMALPSDELYAATVSLMEPLLRPIFSDGSLDKQTRDAASAVVHSSVSAQLTKDFADTPPPLLGAAMEKATKCIHRDIIFETGLRCDGRTVDQLRPISSKVDLFVPLHGSGLFQRGNTQVLGIVAFDSKEAAFRSDAISALAGGVKEKHFMLHYEFPPFATNEIGTMRGGNRRELGHGALAEKALRAVVPADFPFTIRLTTEVLESNGSSSMASVCAGSLALMDAGVHLHAPVGGVAMGLLSRVGGDGVLDYRILSDITGMEDHLGEMDFKVAGTRDDLTAVQLDLKIAGISTTVLGEALVEATTARRRVLDAMAETLSGPRTVAKDSGPCTEQLTVGAHKRPRFVGVGGYNVKKVEAETGVQISPVDEDTFVVFAPNRRALDEAKQAFEQLLADDAAPQLDVGGVYPARIVELRDNGVMVILHPGMQPALLHMSQIDARRVHHPSALNLEVGQELMVKYFGRDPASGQMRLSRKVLQTSVPRAGQQAFKGDAASEPPPKSPWATAARS